VTPSSHKQLPGHDHSTPPPPHLPRARKPRHQPGSGSCAPVCVRFPPVRGLISLSSTVRPVVRARTDQGETRQKPSGPRPWLASTRARGLVPDATAPAYRRAFSLSVLRPLCVYPSLWEETAVLASCAALLTALSSATTPTPCLVGFVVVARPSPSSSLRFSPPSPSFWVFFFFSSFHLTLPIPSLFLFSFSITWLSIGEGLFSVRASSSPRPVGRVSLPREHTHTPTAIL
jgi:hypothetical protein